MRGGAFIRAAGRRARCGCCATVATRPRSARSPGAPRAGLLADLPDGLGEEELTRQADLGRLLGLAESSTAGPTVADFLRDLEERFGAESQGRGVHLLTYHRAKGLEWEAVFLPRLEEKELPSRQGAERRARGRGAPAALRRHDAREALADAHLDGGRKPSRFLDELGVVGPARPKTEKPESTPEYEALKPLAASARRPTGCPRTWSSTTRTLAEIAARPPANPGELARSRGVGPAKLERYGDDVLESLSAVAEPSG